MNKIVLVGRLVKNPILTQCKNSEKCYTKFTIAVLRNFKTSSGERKSDFIPLVMWEKKAEIACEYLEKGDIISVGGKLITRTYEDNEKKRRYIIEVSVDDFRIIGKAKYNNINHNN